MHQTRTWISPIEEGDRSYLLRKPEVGLIAVAFSMCRRIPIGRCDVYDILAHACIFPANDKNNSADSLSGMRVRARKLGISHEYLLVLTVAQLRGNTCVLITHGPISRWLSSCRCQWLQHGDHRQASSANGAHHSGRLECAATVGPLASNCIYLNAYIGAPLALRKVADVSWVLLTSLASRRETVTSW